MKMSSLFLHTLKEEPRDAEVVSHKLMLRACMLKKLASGIYTYLPYGLKAIRKVEQIIREEMNAAGAQECLMPGVQPSEIWKESGRWDMYGKELLRFTDRKGAEFALGPTHEEVITDIVRDYVRSYKELPLNLYQIQTKFRDEIRPRFGLMRAREFVMKDAYSFDADEAGLDQAYEAMRQAYHRICLRLGFRYRAVEADSGAIGGSGSQEFMVLADTGEDTILYCDQCDYAANQEKASSRLEQFPQDTELRPKEDVLGEGLIHTEPLSKFLGIPVWKTTKTLLFEADDRVVAVMVRGDCDVNEVKVANVLG